MTPYNVTLPSMAKQRKTSNANGWSELDHDLLRSILVYLVGSVFDLFSFSRVCTSWRAAAKSFTASRPPMLMLHLKPRSDRPANFEFRKVCDPNFRLTRSLRVKTKTYVGFSFGHHISLDKSHSRLALVNPVTGVTTRLPQIPKASGHFFPVMTAVLSAPPTSPDCVLLCWGRAQDHGFGVCSVHGNDQWILQTWRYGFVRSPIVIDNKKVCVLVTDSVVIMDLLLPADDHPISVEFRYNISLPPQHTRYFPVLVRLGGELLVTTFPSLGRNLIAHRLNLGPTTWVWENVETLGGRALFMSYCGGVVSENPTAWGGRGDSVYYVFPGTNVVGRYFLQNKRFEMVSDFLPELQFPRELNLPAGMYNWI